jgi:two-component system sensor histidine kinase/response regulator
MKNFDPDSFTILIVDDIPKNIQVLGSFLRKNNYRVAYATNGHQALAQIDKMRFDLILLDIMMPDLNGIEVCRRIRQDERNCDLPVIFLTAKTDRESLLEGFAAGGQDYINKPFDGPELLARVKTQLELKSLRDKQKELNQLLEEKVQERTRELREAYSRLEAAKRLDQFSMVALLITELRTRKPLPAKKSVPVADLIRHATGIHEEKIREKKINIRSEGEQDSCLVQGDPTLLNLCFESILDNSVKYSNPGGEVALRVSATDKGVRCEFIDHGRGFTPEAQKNLFKLFGLGEQHLDQHVGLDLALVRLIMDAHEGSIEVQNNAPSTGGATVTLIFPNKVT